MLKSSIDGCGLHLILMKAGYLGLLGWSRLGGLLSPECLYQLEMMGSAHFLLYCFQYLRHQKILVLLLGIRSCLLCITGFIADYSILEIDRKGNSLRKLLK